MSRPTLAQQLLREQERQRRQREGGRHTDLSDRMSDQDWLREALNRPLSPTEIRNEGIGDISPTNLSPASQRMLDELYAEQQQQLAVPPRPEPSPRLAVPTRTTPSPRASTSVGVGASAFTTTDEEFQRLYDVNYDDDELSPVPARPAPSPRLTRSPLTTRGGPSTSAPAAEVPLDQLLEGLRATANNRPSPGHRLPTPTELPGSLASSPRSPARRPPPTPPPPPEGPEDMRQVLDQLRQDEDQRLQGRNIHAVTHTNTITTVYKDGRTPATRRISTRTAGGRTVARTTRGRGRGRGRPPRARGRGRGT